MIMGGAAELQYNQLNSAEAARNLRFDQQQAMIAARTGQYASAEQARQDGNFINQAMDFTTANMEALATGLGAGATGGASDRKLKKNISLIGRSPSGINIYSFEYKNKEKFGKGVYQGVMADEMPSNVVIKLNDYDAVDYEKIDVNFKQI